MLIILCGVSGSGKTTIQNGLLKDHPHRYTNLVSHTTRDKRPGEVDEVDYYFISPEEFDQKEAAGEFVEVDNGTMGDPTKRYGLDAREIKQKMKSGKNVLTILSPAGAKAFVKMYPHDSIVFEIVPETTKRMNQLLLRAQNGISQEDIFMRLKAEVNFFEDMKVVKSIYLYNNYEDDFVRKVHEQIRVIEKIDANSDKGLKYLRNKVLATGADLKEMWLSRNFK